jgi:hypothetical protein
MITFFKLRTNQTPARELPLRLSNQWRRPFRLARIVGGLGMLLLTVFLAPTVRADQTVHLVWDASTDPTVSGYNVYYGGESGAYTNMTSTGIIPDAVVSGLVEGATYYFAVTAFDANGLESFFSNEVIYTVPVGAGAVQLQISGASGGAFTLGGTGQTGHSYQIQASTDLIAWTTIGTQAVDSSGVFAFTDNDAPNYPARFYRTLDVQP